MQLASLALLVAFQHSSGHIDFQSPERVDHAPWLNPPCGGVKSSKYPKLLCLGKKGEDKEYKSLWDTMESLTGKHPKLACSDIEIECEASRVCTVMLAWMGNSSTQRGLRGDRKDRHAAAACLSRHCPHDVLASAHVLNGIPGATCPHTGTTLHEVPTKQAHDYDTDSKEHKEVAVEPEPVVEQAQETTTENVKDFMQHEVTTRRTTLVSTTLPEAQDFGCCFSYGFGAMMKPCCLKTEMNVRKDDCKKLGDGFVGGATGWSLKCPLTADEAAQAITTTPLATIKPPTTLLATTTPIAKTTTPQAVVSTPVATTSLLVGPSSTTAAALVTTTTTTSYAIVNVQSLSKSKKEDSSSSVDHSDVEKPKDKDRTLDIFVGCVLIMLLLMMILDRLFKTPQEGARRADPLE